MDPQAALVPPTITGTPPDGVVGVSYTFGFHVTGDPDPEVSLNAKIVPPGLELSKTGMLLGAPTLAGTFTFTVRADNGMDPVATQEVTVVVTDPKPVVPPVSGGEGKTAPTVPGGRLPTTGSGVQAAAAVVAAVMLLVGGAAVSVASRRRKGPSLGLI